MGNPNTFIFFSELFISQNVGSSIGFVLHSCGNPLSSWTETANRFGKDYTSIQEILNILRN